MAQRLDYIQQSAGLFNTFLGFSTALAQGSVIDESIRGLVDIRASQMNGCAFCLDMHVKQAKLRGERELRLYHIAIWRESPLFDARERAALMWTEALTKLADHGVPEDVFNTVRQQFTEKEITDLTFSVMAINAWNRLNIAFLNVPGSKDKAFGLDKAGLQ